MQNWCMSIVYYRRSIETRLQIAREQFPAVLVTGARQAGKSTLLRQTSPECRYVSLMIRRSARWLRTIRDYS